MRSGLIIIWFQFDLKVHKKSIKSEKVIQQIVVIETFCIFQTMNRNVINWKNSDDKNSNDDDDNINIKKRKEMNEDKVLETSCLCKIFLTNYNTH